MAVSASIAVTKASAPRYFPATISPTRSGEVSSNSKVPSRFSSAKLRMLITGIRITSTTERLCKSGEITNSFRFSRSSSPPRCMPE